MRGNIIDIKGPKVFAIPFRFFGIILIIVGFFYIKSHPVIGLLNSVAALIVLLSYEGVVIDKKDKIIKRYTSILLLRFGKPEQYTVADHIFYVDTEKPEGKGIIKPKNRYVAYLHSSRENFLLLKDTELKTLLPNLEILGKFLNINVRKL
ncbi:hypothetical protein [Marinigracilibium pacificum]|uniref:Uncharacterized protein n=1 Tax=Marinigracilibium pacificum TaxID=2729599 RepID=A0A848IYQ3_9BACT|nr:hypothetical protein [Marinigracilibium pacificum]NMM48766.1 hypothetical protein [Marinigracilibium pacificum]